MPLFPGVAFDPATATPVRVDLDRQRDLAQAKSVQGCRNHAFADLRLRGNLAVGQAAFAQSQYSYFLFSRESHRQSVV